MARLSVPKDERGRFPARVDPDPGLVGLGAFNHPAVVAWHEWILREYRPRYHTILVTPCSNVKPYPSSPMSRRIAGLLKRLGLWNGVGPWRVEWVYLSDLLVWVPYWRAWDYPACCYELHPEELLSSPPHRRRVVSILASLLERFSSCRFVVFLPKKHLVLWDAAARLAAAEVNETRVKYHLFRLEPLREALAAAAQHAARV